MLLAVRGGGSVQRAGEGFGAAARAAATEFLDSTAEVPDDGDDLESYLILTDGARTWESSDLEEVTSADDSDPTWLRLQAAINSAGLAGSS